MEPVLLKISEGHMYNALNDNLETTTVASRYPDETVHTGYVTDLEDLSHDIGL